MLKLLKKIIGQHTYLNLKYRWLDTLRKFHGLQPGSYSQCGEDMVIRHLLEEKSTGFYVDIGAYHPIDLSNTYHFYLSGWRGLNVDATPGSMALFNVLRPRDINVEAAVADDEAKLTYYLFDRGELNTLSAESAKQAVERGNRQIGLLEVKSYPLSGLLDTFVPAGLSIDLLSVDAEGYDEAILRSNNWNKYRPAVILFEKHISTLDIVNEELHHYLSNLGYGLVGKAGPTFIYKYFG